LGLVPTSTLGGAARQSARANAAENEVLLNFYASDTASKTTSKAVGVDRVVNTYVYVIRADAEDNSKYRRTAQYVKELGLDFCLVSSSTADKLKGRPKFIELKALVKDLKAHVSSKDYLNAMRWGKMALAANNNQWVQNAKALVSERIDDLALAKAVREIASLNSLNDDCRYVFGRDPKDPLVAGLIRHTPELQAFKREWTAFGQANSDYPLLKSVYGVDRHNARDMAFYLNAKYAATKRGK
jgi:hypothetical protein